MYCAETANARLDALLGQLADVGSAGSDEWRARCPAHDDRDPSLSVSVRDDKILLHCHAGCTTEAVVSAVGMEMSDLFLGGDRQTAKRDGRRGRDIEFADADEAIAELEHQMGEPSTSRWDYHDADGELVGAILRWNQSDGGKEIRPVARDGDGWIIGGMPEPRPLYMLPELANADRVYVVEGEKAADAARSIGLAATTSPHGSKSAKKADWAPLAGKEIILVPDNDDPGWKYVESVAKILAEVDPAPTIKLLELDHLDEGGDIADWVDHWGNKGKTEEKMRRRIENLADQAEEYQPDPGDSSPSGGAPHGKESAATKLTEIAKDNELWHTPDGEAYATVEVDGHWEHWPVRSKGFKRWLVRDFYLREGKPPGAQAVNDALLVIEGKAYHDGEEHSAHVRVAGHEDGIYIDLCNDAWAAVRVTTKGWEVIDKPPVRFRRAKAMLPLPTPSEGGSVGKLRRFLNVTDEHWPLVASWLLAAMRPSGPYPVLAIYGEQGSAKSTAARVLRELVDPNSAPLRCEPRTARDLMIAANNGWVIALDNLSSLQPWLSDALCRLSTGGGFSTRTLYENDEETIFAATRPLILTGIEEVATRGDLMDRSLLVNLPTIREDRRRTEREFWAKFDDRKPKLLGAMLTAVSEAMANLPDVVLDSPPRLADFAVWATAGEVALGLETGEFMVSHAGNRTDANAIVLESSPVTRYLLNFAKGLGDGDDWEDQASKLLSTLEEAASDRDKHLKSWPTTPRALSSCLRRLAPNLRQAGVNIEFGKMGRGNKRRNSIKISRR